MINYKTKVKRKKSKIEIYRTGDKIIGYGETKLKDSSASITIHKTNKPNNLNIDFGYNSEKNRKFRRDIELNLSEAIELRNFLDEYISNTKSNKINILIFNPFINHSEFETKFGLKKIDNISISGAKLKFYKLFPFGRNIHTNIIKDAHSEIYGVRYEANSIDIVSIENYFDSFKSSEVEYSLIQLNNDHLSNELNYCYALLKGNKLTEYLLESKDLKKIIKWGKEQNFPAKYFNGID